MKIKKVTACLLNITVISVLIFTGCGSAPVEKTNTSTETGKVAMKRPDVMGQVKSIVGNSVVLELAKIPTRDSATNGDASGDMPVPMDGPPPSGASSGGPSPNGDVPSGKGMGGFSNIALTGETMEMLIPVGVTITSGRGSEAKEIDIADIKKEDVLSIFYVEGTTDIERITVR